MWLFHFSNDQRFPNLGTPPALKGEVNLAPSQIAVSNNNLVSNFGEEIWRYVSKEMFILVTPILGIWPKEINVNVSKNIHWNGHFNIKD